MHSRAFLSAYRDRAECIAECSVCHKNEYLNTNKETPALNWVRIGFWDVPNENALRNGKNNFTKNIRNIFNFTFKLFTLYFLFARRKKKIKHFELYSDFWMFSNHITPHCNQPGFHPFNFPIKFLEKIFYGQCIAPFYCNINSVCACFFPLQRFF